MDLWTDFFQRTQFSLFCWSLWSRGWSLLINSTLIKLELPRLKKKKKQPSAFSFFGGGRLENSLYNLTSIDSTTSLHTLEIKTKNPPLCHRCEAAKQDRVFYYWPRSKWFEGGLVDDGEERRTPQMAHQASQSPPAPRAANKVRPRHCAWKPLNLWRRCRNYGRL